MEVKNLRTQTSSNFSNLPGLSRGRLFFQTLNGSDATASSSFEGRGRARGAVPGSLLREVLR